MDRSPITRQRSPWLPVADVLAPTGGVVVAHTLRRRTNDGTLSAVVAIEDGVGWHLSVSFRDHRGKPRRYPSWDELADARDRLLPADLAFVMHLPAAGEYVAVHPTTFHVFQNPPPA